jgi:hypothetical protein
LPFSTAGTTRHGEQSVITVNSIIGTKGVPNINPFDLQARPDQQQAVRP